ncbi:hypothetical protein [Celeribacter litoreus]|uniref:hypothetical protein n=1 Tax=Celeribacter litoreus TaxID=2876714 RepID=UPI001CCB2D7C|nr:hypothetical protein [Celeribacter litoreus]MCA0043573.1 hypothetical protein [Celeribacter litoreus]
MELAFHIKGHTCVAERVAMRGNTIEADFGADMAGVLKDAFYGADVVAVPGLSVTYSVQHLRTGLARGCTATFSVNSSTGRVLH